MSDAPRDEPHPDETEIISNTPGADGSEPTYAYEPGGPAARLVEIVDQYLADRKAGRAPDREALLAAHPDLAEQLDACLAGIDFIHGAESPGGETPLQLGDFRILREVGRGGMGAVYEAEQVSLGRRVALKVLRFGAVSDPEAVERFQREAATVATLHHTNIVPIHAVGSENGVNYYAMQFIEGRSLAEVLEADGPAEATTVARWGLQAAEALAHAHARDVVHRDVKPSNLLIDAEGRIWLTDFGLAKRTDDVTLSMTGALLGTPRYMSPEQASTATRKVDHRTDIYSLGASLYELVTGQPVFSADTPHAVITQILTADPQPPGKVRGNVPRDLDTILMKCLAKDADARYESAEQLAVDLRAFLDDRPIQARRPNLLELAGRWLRRQKRSVALALGGAVASVLLIVLAVVGWYVYHRYQLAWLSLGADAPPLVAELLDDSGEPVLEPVTVPTQQPLELPEGNYSLRVSKTGQLSQTHGVRLARGERSELKLRLDDSLIGPTIAVKRTFRTATFSDGADVILLDDDGLARVEPGTAREAWRVELGEKNRPAEIAKAAPGFVWPWWRVDHAHQYGGHGKFDIGPFVLERAVDVNGDGQDDLLLAARHQAWVMALSGANGQVLWLAPQGSDVRRPNDEANPRSNDGVRSAVLAPPQWLADLNGDGVEDLLITWADIGTSADAAAGKATKRRWIEALSGANGESLWRHELPAQLFALPQGTQAPYHFRWFTHRVGGHSSGGSGGMSNIGGRYIRDVRYETTRSGMHEYVPSVPRVIPHHGEPRVIVLAGTHWVTLDPKSGKPAGEPHTIGLRPGLEPIWADVAGDATPEAILLEDLKPNQQDAHPLRLAVWSVEESKLLWRKDITAYWPWRPYFRIPEPRWPLAEDLDGDGKCELIVPTGGLVRRPGPTVNLNWGTFAVLDGATGKPRWEKRIVNMDDYVHHFAIGPDINADGHREVYTATLSDADFKVYVDCLSGKDGRRLWLASKPVRPSGQGTDYWLAPLQWWHAGADGWPQLIARALLERDGEEVCLFSAGTGRLTHFARDIDRAEPVDVNGDGVEDLLTLRQADGESDGELEVIRGVIAQPWRRLGNIQPDVAADYDGDGVLDLVRATVLGEITAFSGRNGRMLWECELNYVTHTKVKVADDLNGDGTPDLLAYVQSSGAGSSVYHPLQAVSGRTGKPLWRGEIQVNVVEWTAMVDTRDLDGDGRPEVIFVSANDWAYPRDRRGYSTGHYQLWLAVLSGRDGRVKWKAPLSPDYGEKLGGTTLGFDRLWLETDYSDLDGDGVLDFVLPAEATPGGKNGGTNLVEQRAFSGKTGNVLWRHPLPLIRNNRQESLQTTLTPSIADVDGDGRAEVISLVVKDVNQPSRKRLVQIRRLDGRTGEEAWMWEADVADDWGRRRDWGGVGRSATQRPKPFVLRAKDGKAFIALSVDNRRLGATNFLVILRPDGTELARREIDKESYYGGSTPRAWALDIDRDGADELVYVDGDYLIAARPDDLDNSLWKRRVGPSGGNSVLDVLPRLKNRPATIVWQTSQGLSRGPAVYGLDAASGKTLWLCAGPQPASGTSMDHIAALSSGGKASPLVYFQYGQVSLARQAALPGKARATYALRAAARTDFDGDDPRLLRPRPWVMSDDTEAMLPFFAWSGFFSLTLLLIPGGYVLWLVRRRQWGLKSLLLAPVAAAVFITGWMAETPSEAGQLGLGLRMLFAVAAAPVFIVLFLLIRWIIAGRWRAVLITLAAVLLVSGGLAVLLPMLDGGVDPEERYSSEGWYWIFPHGGYVTCWLMMFVLPVTALVRRLRQVRREPV